MQKQVDAIQMIMNQLELFPDVILECIMAYQCHYFVWSWPTPPHEWPDAETRKKRNMIWIGEYTMGMAGVRGTRMILSPKFTKMFSDSFSSNPKWKTYWKRGQSIQKPSIATQGSFWSYFDDFWCGYSPLDLLSNKNLATNVLKHPCIGNLTDETKTKLAAFAAKRKHDILIHPLGSTNDDPEGTTHAWFIPVNIWDKISNEILGVMDEAKDQNITFEWI